MSDRKRLKLTQAEVLERCEYKMSISTYRRAEDGGRVGVRYLRAIAKALGFEADRYVLDGVEASAPAKDYDVSGEWIAYFVEDDRAAGPYVTKEDVRLAQTGREIEGRFKCRHRGRVRIEEIESGFIERNMLFATSTVTHWSAPIGYSCMQLVMSGASDDWLEGMATWLDAESLIVECSKYILVRKGSQDFDYLIANAEAIMKEEMKIFRARRALQTKKLGG